MRVCVIGLGYVGLVTAAGAGTWHHETTGVDADASRVDSLRAGIVPFHEPGLDRAVRDGVKGGFLRVTTDIASAVRSAEIVFVAVGTHDGNGGWQTTTMTACLETIAPHVADDATLVIRSTLPPAYIARLAGLVRELRAAAERPAVPVMLNPEFTKEGTAVRDFLEPDRVVIGRIDDPEGRGTRALRQFYNAVTAPILEMEGMDASLTKLGSNLFLATKISFANELAALCDAYGATVDDVVRAMGLDTRIGTRFLRPGVGFGGSCLPHQVAMTTREARAAGHPTPLLEGVEAVNQRQRIEFVDEIEAAAGGTLEGARVGVLGLTFKPDTDDLRDAPSLTITAELVRRGASVVAHDPMPRARVQAASLTPGLEVASTPQEAVQGADAIALVTEWAEYLDLDWASLGKLVARRAVVDGRNALARPAITAAGFTYRGFGRGTAAPAATFDHPATHARHARRHETDAPVPVPAADGAREQERADEWTGALMAAGVDAIIGSQSVLDD